MAIRGLRSICTRFQAPSLLDTRWLSIHVLECALCVLYCVTLLWVSFPLVRHSRAGGYPAPRHSRAGGNPVFTCTPLDSRLRRNDVLAWLMGLAWLMRPSRKPLSLHRCVPFSKAIRDELGMQPAAANVLHTWNQRPLWREVLGDGFCTVFD